MIETNLAGTSSTWGTLNYDGQGYDETVIVVPLPSTTTFQPTNGPANYCGFRSSVTVSQGTGHINVNVPYIVLPTAANEQATCGDSAGPGDSATDVVQTIFMRELAAVITDPAGTNAAAPDPGWYDSTHSLDVGTACSTGANDTGALSGSLAAAPYLWSNLDDDCSLSVPGSFTNLGLSAGASSVPAGISASYTTVGTDGAGDQFSDETGATTFTISPNAAGTGASCTGNQCTATKPGTYTVTATDGSRTASAPLTVTAAAASSLVLIPGTATVYAGETQTYSVSALDAYGNSVSNAGTTYAITPTANGTEAMCIADQCTAAVAGTYTVTASNGAAHGTSTLTVLANPLVGGVIPADVTLGKLKVEAHKVTGTTDQVTLSCSGGKLASCDVQLNLTIRQTAVSGKYRYTTTVTLGTATTDLVGGQTKKVKVSLNATGKRLLKKQKKKLSTKLAIVQTNDDMSVKVATETVIFPR